MAIAPSVPMVTQAPIRLAVIWPAAALALNSARLNPGRLKAKVSPAPPPMKLRRETASATPLSPHGRRLSSAARSMALTMRGYAPQRQILPFMWRTISSRVGFLVVASNAAACMIWPG
jgi:hypothetical protein